MLNWIFTSSVLILAVLGLRLLFRGRISQRMTYALWALVLLRLLIPGSILSSAASVANLVSELTAPPVFSAPVLNEEEALEQVLTENKLTQIDFDTLPAFAQSTYTQQADALVESSRQEAQAEIQKQETRYYSIRQILVAVWLLGAVLTAVCLLWANARFSRALSRSRRRTEIPMPVYRSPVTESPCLFGLFRPAIYLPEDMPEGDVPYVLAHEKTHLRHLDHVWSVLRCLCLAVHWFNPLVWIAVKVSRTDSELACDEGALEYLGDESREDYGRVLIRMSCGRDQNLLLTATTMSGDKRTLYARVKAIAKKPRIIVMAVVLLAIAAAIAAGCVFTGPVIAAGSPEENQTAEPTEPQETASPEDPVSAFYAEYLELSKTDREAAILQYQHFEDEESKELTLENRERVLSYEILALEKLSDALWALRVRLETEYEEGPYELYHFVGLIDGEMRVMHSTRAIPTQLREGLDLEPYEHRGDSLLETTGPVATEPQFELPWNMMSALDSNFELDYKNHYIMALEKVEVKYIPSDDVETIYELNNELVMINAAVYGESEKWVLVRYASTMDGGGNMGWVKISGLTEYTEENKALLRFPVTVKEGSKDAETGKELQRFEYAMGDPDGEYVRIGNEFGSFTVKVEDIVYPSTTKTTDRIWGEWEK